MTRKYHCSHCGRKCVLNITSNKTNDSFVNRLENSEYHQCPIKGAGDIARWIRRPLKKMERDVKK
jgi:hypothetical protein